MAQRTVNPHSPAFISSLLLLDGGPQIYACAERAEGRGVVVITVRAMVFPEKKRNLYKKNTAVQFERAKRQPKKIRKKNKATVTRVLGYFRRIIYSLASVRVPQIDPFGLCVLLRHFRFLCP